MRRNIKNALRISVDGEDMTKASQIEFYVRQGQLLFTYIPQVIASDELYFEIPFEHIILSIRKIKTICGRYYDRRFRIAEIPQRDRPY